VKEACAANNYSSILTVLVLLRVGMAFSEYRFHSLTDKPVCVSIAETNMRESLMGDDDGHSTAPGHLAMGIRLRHGSVLRFVGLTRAIVRVGEDVWSKAGLAILLTLRAYVGDEDPAGVYKIIARLA